jgi:hypothetical protein
MILVEAMVFNDMPFGSRPIPQSDPDGQPAEVVDLAARRRAADAIPQIPDDVLDEIDTASQRWHELQAAGSEVRFDTDTDTGRVAATLRDLGGNVVRALPLRDVFGFDDGPQSAA